MNINKTAGDQSDNWMYLPDTATLFQYLDRASLIELSKCCKSYRNQLEYKVLEKLDLQTWIYYNQDTYKDLMFSIKCNKMLGFLKSDLGNKLKFVKKVALDSDTLPYISKNFVKFLPNIKSIKFSGIELFISRWRSLVVILKGLKYLEHVDLGFMSVELDSIYYKKQIFPLSLKSLKVFHDENFDGDIGGLIIYDTIDSRYTNLYSIEIVSNRMLQNLSSGMPNLQEVAIYDIYNLDKSKLVDFFIANPQLKKIDTCFQEYNEEIFKTILSSKYLEHLRISHGSLEEIELDNIPFNYSIKYLDINTKVPTGLILKFINVCNNLETLDLINYRGSTDLNWPKLDRRINILKVNKFDSAQWAVKIDASMLFYQVNIKIYGSIEEFIDKYNIDKLKNYKFFHSDSKYCILKLNNK